MPQLGFEPRISAFTAVLQLVVPKGATHNSSVRLSRLCLQDVVVQYLNC